jgi:hypothetical protein
MKFERQSRFFKYDTSGTCFDMISYNIKITGRKTGSNRDRFDLNCVSRPEVAAPRRVFRVKIPS